MAEEAARRLTAAARRPLREALRARLLALCVFGIAAALAAAGAVAQPKKKDAPLWAELPPAKQKILEPLAAEWDRLDTANRARWLGVAKRYPKMTPVGQKRTQSRMKAWAKLTPAQRDEAREKYKRLKKKEDEDLRARWQEYQALPPGERRALAAPAAPASSSAERSRTQRRAASPERAAPKQ